MLFPPSGHFLPIMFLPIMSSLSLHPRSFPLDHSPSFIYPRPFRPTFDHFPPIISLYHFRPFISLDYFATIISPSIVSTQSSPDNFSQSFTPPPPPIIFHQIIFPSNISRAIILHPIISF